MIFETQFLIEHLVIELETTLHQSSLNDLKLLIKKTKRNKKSLNLNEMSQVMKAKKTCLKFSARSSKMHSIKKLNQISLLFQRKTWFQCSCKLMNRFERLTSSYSDLRNLKELNLIYPFLFCSKVNMSLETQDLIDNALPILVLNYSQTIKVTSKTRRSNSIYSFLLRTIDSSMI